MRAANGKNTGRPQLIKKSEASARDEDEKVEGQTGAKRVTKAVKGVVADIR